ncbi:3'-5' exonuclease domain-containing protein 2 [Prevotella sp. TCVGH]|uniref:3'-5' exonuclease n=1 Tax=Hoylesella timonensis S9-PR14 TaxID=1401062 RepID=A0A098YR32_9BACT|nr:MULTISPECIES: 3'-5' exonuclease [Prevotellaceae]KGI22165.1 3'-5' exonuclease [Hoylesella timonensis S9-PR14]MCL6747799.1 3'-5' exonuclease domain-containing protein 2 [Prevotella sp. TCVGH]
MMRILYSKFNKEAIHELPQVLFTGRIIVITSEKKAEKAVDFLLKQSILGVDTETRPVFRKGQSYKVSLLQVATHDTCFLFRLNILGITPSIKRLLENTETKMIGLSWHDDLLALHKRSDFKKGNFIDLQDIIGDLGIKDLSLQKLYANIFRQKISKRQRLTNWNNETLSEKQKQYAATDAWACIQLYEEIMRLKVSGDYQLVQVEEESKNNEVKND